MKLYDVLAQVRSTTNATKLDIRVYEVKHGVRVALQFAEQVNTKEILEKHQILWEVEPRAQSQKLKFCRSHQKINKIGNQKSQFTQFLYFVSNILSKIIDYLQ